MEWAAKYWAEAGFALALAAVTAWIKLTISQQNAIKRGLKALLRDRIIQAYNDCAERGYCPIFAREGAEALYKEYKALGGNGTLAHLVTGLHALPTEKPGNQVHARGFQADMANRIR